MIYTGNSLEFGITGGDLLWNHCNSTPHRSETNGIAERAARRVKEGTSAILLQSGLDEKWWADSMECYCFLRNVQVLSSDEKIPYERRFGEPFGGPLAPFGSLVEYHPISCKRRVKTPPVWSKGPARRPHWIYVVRVGASGKETWSRTLRSWKLWKRHKSVLGESTQTGHLMPKNGEDFFLSQMDQSSWQGEIRYSENPPQFRISLHEVRSTRMFFKESYKSSGNVQARL